MRITKPELFDVSSNNVAAYSIVSINTKIGTQGTGAKTTLGSSIKLPFPQNLSVGGEYSWGALETGLLGLAAENVTSGNDKVQNLERTMGQLGESATNAALKNIGSSIGGQGGANAQQIALKKTGMAWNPKEEVFFNGVQHRTYDLVFDLAPKSEKEGEEFVRAINSFNVFASPSLSADKQYFIMPGTVNVKIVSNGQEAISRTNLAITGIDVDLTPDGQWSTFKNGVPIHTVLTISFIELDLPTKERELNQGLIKISSGLLTSGGFGSISSVEGLAKSGASQVSNGISNALGKVIGR